MKQKFSPVTGNTYTVVQTDSWGKDFVICWSLSIFRAETVFRWVGSLGVPSGTSDLAVGRSRDFHINGLIGDGEYHVTDRPLAVY